MTDRPILFSAPMVRALLDGRKTQTRRVLNPQPYDFVTEGKRSWNASGCVGGRIAISDRALLDLHHKPDIGDRLWVRETCRTEELCLPPKFLRASPKERQITKRTEVLVSDELDGADGVRYLADDAWIGIPNTPEAGEAWSELHNYRGGGGGSHGHPVPSIHMPRWASRITLTVTDVRVERLQDISEADAAAEGALLPWSGLDPSSDTRTARSEFEALWNIINGKGAWDANPWVAAISFDVRKGNIDA